MPVYYEEYSHNHVVIDVIKTETGKITVGNTYEGCYFSKCTEKEYTEFHNTCLEGIPCLGGITRDCDVCMRCPE